VEPELAGAVGYGGAVIDGFRLPPAGRVVLPLALLLALLWGGDGGRPGTAGPAPPRPAVRAARALQPAVLGRHLHLVQPAARQAQHGRRGPAPVAVPAAALAGALVAVAWRQRAVLARRPDGRLPVLRPRAPPSGQPG
jgi:hypothetical protein